jgi:hypothetical protein
VQWQGLDGYRKWIICGFDERRIQDSNYKAPRGLNISYIISIPAVLWKKKRNIEVAESKGSRVSNTYYPWTGLRLEGYEKGLEKRSDSGVLWPQYVPLPTRGAQGI